ncbi:MAG: hypothetical protein M1827_002647 [Pycnora praestabilis]|nr:MAG: hypothetical protein M1827_002647 [Pycnora praestabilis]
MDPAYPENPEHSERGQDPANSQNSVTTHSIDPNADVILVLPQASSIFEYLVSSKVLTLVSPIFAALFGPDFQEGQTSPDEKGRRRYTIQEDDPTALELFCNLIHYRQSAIPTKPELQLLYDLAVLSDKYDCVRSVGPWAEGWIGQLKDAITDSKGLERLLFVAYTFESDNLFRSISSKMMRTASCSEIFSEQETESTSFTSILRSSLRRENFKVLLSVQREIENHIMSPLNSSVSYRTNTEICPELLSTAPRSPGPSSS